MSADTKQAHADSEWRQVHNRKTGSTHYVKPSKDPSALEKAACGTMLPTFLLEDGLGWVWCQTCRLHGGK